MKRLLQRRILSWGFSCMLAIALVTLGLPNVAIAQSTPKAESTEIATKSATDAFREAYANRYTWDAEFPGYSAEVSVYYHGKLDQGMVRVKPDFTVEVINIDQDDVRQFVAEQLQMELIHRKQAPFDKIHGKNTFKSEGTDESGALKIREVGDEMNSHYQVNNKVLTQVNRVMGAVAVKVDTLGTTKTPEGYLVSHFQTTYCDAKTGEVLEKQDVRDFHEKIGKYYLLTNRDIRSDKEGNPEAKLTADISLRFNDVQPL
jgi:Protein of unknown function (DUF3386)